MSIGEDAAKKYYATFAEAVSARENDDVVITLVKNADAPYTLSGNGELKVKLNSHSLTVNPESDAKVVKTETSGEVTTYSLETAVASVNKTAGYQQVTTRYATVAEAVEAATGNVGENLPVTLLGKDGLYALAGYVNDSDASNTGEGYTFVLGDDVTFADTDPAWAPISATAGATATPSPARPSRAPSTAAPRA